MAKRRRGNAVRRILAHGMSQAVCAEIGTETVPR